MDTVEPTSCGSAEDQAVIEAATIECSIPDTGSRLPEKVTKTRYQLTCDQSPGGENFREVEQKRLAQLAHDEEFKVRTGMSPTRCYYLVLLSLMLRLLGGGWIMMVALEYARYYVVNDLAVFEIVRTATASPQYVLQAFLFPFWGIVSDRVSRKKVVVAASLAACCSAWLLTLVPCIEIFAFTRVLNLVADVGGPIRDAMLRDIFSQAEWESEGGGATGIKARLAMLAQGAWATSTIVGLCLLKFGEKFHYLPNEYTVHKHECGKYCVHPGNYSWEGPWHIDGTLRLLMLMGTIVLSLETLLVAFFFPETLPLDQRLEGGFCRFMKDSWLQLGKPWNNLRVFATSQLRMLIGIRFLTYIVAAGGSQIYLSFYNRFEWTSFEMTCMAIVAGASTWLTTAAVPRLVNRFGDLRGIWFSGAFVSIMSAVCWALLPPGYGYLVFAIYPMFSGPSFAFGTLAPELMAKLVPGELQGTYQTAKSFIFRLSMAVFSWPWTALFVKTKNLAYPLDGIPIWVGICFGVVVLLLILRMFRNDPKDALARGEGLEVFWASSYAKSDWYRLHVGSNLEAEERATAEEKPQQNTHDDMDVSVDEAARSKEAHLAQQIGVSDSLNPSRGEVDHSLSERCVRLEL